MDEIHGGFHIFTFTRCKIVSLNLEGIAVGNKGLYLNRFCLVNTTLIGINVSRRLFVQIAPEELAILLSLLESVSIYFLYPRLPEQNPNHYLTPRGVETLRNKGLRPVLQTNDPSDKFYQRFLAAMPILVEILCNVGRAFPDNNKLVFSKPAVAHQFYGSLLSSLLMIAHSVLYSKLTNGALKVNPGSVVENHGLDPLIPLIAVHGLSNLEQSVRTIIGISGVFATEALVGTLARLWDWEPYTASSLALGFAGVSILVQHHYSTTLRSSKILSDYVAKQELKNKGLQIINSDQLAEFGYFGLDPSNDYGSINLSMLFVSLLLQTMFGTLIRSEYIQDPESGYYWYLFLFLSVVSGSAVSYKWYFNNRRNTYIASQEAQYPIPDLLDISEA